MILYINSVELKHFFKNESRDVILNTNFVIVSNRITRTKVNKEDKERYEISDMIKVLNNAYGVGTDLLQEKSKKKRKKMYFEQLDEYKSTTASIIKASLEDALIVFICTEAEMKKHNFEWLQDWIYTEFDYPTYFYHEYCNIDELLPYSKKKVLKKCDKILLDESISVYNENKNSSDGRAKNLKYLKSLKKKKLQDLCKVNKINPSNMSKEEMVESLYLIL